MSGAIQASTEEHLCDRAAARISQETSVPLSVLRAITRTETGRSRDGVLTPWPWTVNREGAGHWFDTRAAAQQFAERAISEGAHSFDVGCFQINYRWHGAAFSSITQMFDPVENARYAADFLQSLFDETGDWTKAAGAYHSRTETYAKRYRARFSRIHADLDPMAPLHVGLLRQAMPLIANSEAPGIAAPPGGTRGSLVMLGAGARPLVPGFGDSQ